MCDLIGKLQSADNLRSSAALSLCYRPHTEFLEHDLTPESRTQPGQWSPCKRDRLAPSKGESTNAVRTCQKAL
jgi:hypothetical protein